MQAPERLGACPATDPRAIAAEAELVALGLAGDLAAELIALGLAGDLAAELVNLRDPPTGAPGFLRLERKTIDVRVVGCGLP